jgi:hypothetical protein
METFRTAASKPEQAQGPESDRGASDTEHETDAFTDAESGAETKVDGNTPDSRISLSSVPTSLRESIVPAESAAHESESSSSHANSETRSPVPDHNKDNASAPEPEHFDDKKEPEVDSPIRTIPPRIPSPSPTVGTTSTAVTVSSRGNFLFIYSQKPAFVLTCLSPSTMQIEILAAGESGPRRPDALTVAIVSRVPFLTTSEFVRAKLNAWMMCVTCYAPAPHARLLMT